MGLLNEPIEALNKRLKEYFGYSDDYKPIFRIVYSEDEFEKRETWYTDDGFELLTPIVKEVPKYRQWLHNVYILERLVAVPEFQQNELAGSKLSYEPLWVFEDKNHNPLPPKWEVAKLCIDTLHAALGKSNMVKYVDPDNTVESAQIAKAERIFNLEKELFGNETEVGDAIAHGEAIIVPNKQFGETK